MSGRTELTTFVPDGESRKNTAILLVGTSEEFGLDPRRIKAVRSGFWITEELAEVLKADYDEDVPVEPVVKPKRTAKRTATKTSGNRAAKTNSKEE